MIIKSETGRGAFAYRPDRASESNSKKCRARRARNDDVSRGFQSSATLFTTRGENHSTDFKRRSLIKPRHLSVSSSDLLPFPSRGLLRTKAKSEIARPLARRFVPSRSVPFCFIRHRTPEDFVPVLRVASAPFSRTSAEVDGYYARGGLDERQKKCQSQCCVVLACSLYRGFRESGMTANSRNGTRCKSPVNIPTPRVKKN